MSFKWKEKWINIHDIVNYFWQGNFGITGMYCDKVEEIDGASIHAAKHFKFIGDSVKSSSLVHCPNLSGPFVSLQNFLWNQEQHNFMQRQER